MSFEWTSQPLSIQSIANQYTLPVAIRSAPGFRGSSRPIILYSIPRVTFAYGRALRVNKSTKNESESYRPIDSEILAVPMKYPGYFECLPSRSNGKEAGVVPENDVRLIVERMEADHRPQAFYIASPMRVYTVEPNAEGLLNRVWHQIDANQMILFDKLVHVEYTPTLDDELTDDDYAFSWWFCFGKQVLQRNEYALKCILTEQQICYIPCSSQDKLNLIPVGQRGSSNVNKLQMIHNLMEQFSMPTDIKVSTLPGSYAYKDFNGHLQLLGSRAEEFAICASLSTTNIAVMPTNTPLKFVVSPLSSSSSQIQQVLSRCHMFKHSFDMQIRHILISSNGESPSRRTRSRYPKIQTAIDDQFRRFKRSYSVEQPPANTDDQALTPTTDEGYRSGSSATKKRNNPRLNRSTSSVRISTKNGKDNNSQSPHKRRSSTDDDTAAYNSLVHPVRGKKRSTSSPSPPPPALPEKPPNFPFPPAPRASPSSFTYDSGTNLVEVLDSSNAEGAILLDASNELVLALPSDSRFT